MSEMMPERTYTRWRLADVRFLFEPRDVWIGAYWDIEWPMDVRLSIYVCIVPMLPLRFLFLRAALVAKEER